MSDCPSDTPARSRSRRRFLRRRAAALPLALATLALLALIVTEIVGAATQRLVWESQRSRHDELRREAFSALEASLGVLAAFLRADGALYAPAQGWAEPLKLAGYEAPAGFRVEVAVTDESGRFSIPALCNDTYQLRRYFQDLGTDESTAASLADCLADWTDAGDGIRTNGAEAESYPEGVAPPNRPLQSLDELRLVKGFEEVFFDAKGGGNELWERLVGSVTLIGASPAPNINTAPLPVLEVLAARHSFDPESVLALRDGENAATGSTGSVLRNASDLGQRGLPVAISASVTFVCARLRVVATVTRGDAVLVLDTLIEPVSGAGVNAFPFTILQQRVNARLQE
ncbi:MAG: general secretion pathway protein GspK [Puniceicoccales bacterium]|jgi:general secretion pathway protein K|nr:general secretion pathway protein GspK [Puniceicoccales bacterium]